MVFLLHPPSPQLPGNGDIHLKTLGYQSNSPEVNPVGSIKTKRCQLRQTYPGIRSSSKECTSPVLGYGPGTDEATQ